MTEIYILCISEQRPYFWPNIWSLLRLPKRSWATSWNGRIDFPELLIYIAESRVVHHRHVSCRNCKIINFFQSTKRCAQSLCNNSELWWLFKPLNAWFYYVKRLASATLSLATISLWQTQKTKLISWHHKIWKVPLLSWMLSSFQGTTFGVMGNFSRLLGGGVSTKTCSALLLMDAKKQAPVFSRPSAYIF